MTIEEAITVLGEHSADEISPSDRELIKALKLGIEALKRIQWARKEPRAAVVSSLAGDTRSRRSCCFSNKQTPELFNALVLIMSNFFLLH